LIIISLLVVFISFGFLAFSDIPVDQYKCDGGQLLSESDMKLSPCGFLDADLGGKITIEVSFPIYLTGLIGWFGWWFFMVLAGLGVNNLFVDPIMAFKNRPTKLNDMEL
jgi:hypothetical protein